MQERKLRSGDRLYYYYVHLLDNFGEVEYNEYDHDTIEEAIEYGKELLKDDHNFAAFVVAEDVYEFVDDAHGSVFVESDTIYDSRDEDNI
jgi:broad specificity phosphatase PhoE